MEWTTYKTKLLQHKAGEEMKKLARTDADEAILRVPVVLGIRIVAIQPQSIVIVLQHEDVRVAIGVGPFVRTSI